MPLAAIVEPAEITPATTADPDDDQVLACALAGRMQIYDAKGAEWRSVRVRRDPGCAVCKG